ncbi:hypothetical protein H311_02533 [Anncaliia algerae PRA109]|nr:hypothetical protein H311_02533 [Anncaliia algerae PRA109]
MFDSDRDTGFIHHLINKTKEVADDKDEYIYISPNYPSNDVIGFEDSEVENKKYKINKNKAVRVYCDGIYDLFHYGHARSLQQAKNLFDNTTLIVGIPSDEITRKLKGDLIMTCHERVESLKHCKYVDEIVENAPWVITDEFIKEFQIDFVAHDNAPYPGVNHDDIYAPLKKVNKFIPTKRTLGISTTGIITKLVRDYDTYVRRNLERGISAKDMNVSFIKKWDYQLSKKFKILKGNLKDEINLMQKEINFALCYWENMSNVIINKFVEQFNTSEFLIKIKNKLKIKKDEIKCK